MDALFGSRNIARKPVQIHAQYGGIIRSAALRRKRGNHSGEYVARAAGRHSAVPARIYGGFAAARRDHRTLALQRDRNVKAVGKVLGGFDARRLDFRNGKTVKPRHLAGVRGEDNTAFFPV